MKLNTTVAGSKAPNQSHTFCCDCIELKGKGGGDTILSFCKVLRKSAEIYPDPQVYAEDIQFLHSVEKQANIRMSALMSSYFKKKKKATLL